MPVDSIRLKPCVGGCGAMLLCKPGPARGCDDCKSRVKKATKADWDRRNSEAQREKSRAYYHANLDVRMAENRAWKDANRDKIRAYKRKILQRPNEILNNRMRAAMNQRFRIWNGGRSWQDMVGYTPDELAAHLERQFVKGMGWDNVGEWHIDHIVPLASFKFESADDPEFKRAWSLANLRPLWAADNRSKWANRTHLI